MPAKGSLLVKFVKNALNHQIYPGTLYWHSEDDGTFFLHCEHEKNKSCMNEQLKIFQDWDLAKVRKNLVKKNSKKRQRFIQALKKSEYFKLIKKGSTKNRKMFKFTVDTLLSTSFKDDLSKIVAELGIMPNSSSFDPTYAGNNITFHTEDIWNIQSEDNINATANSDSALNQDVYSEEKCLKVYENQMDASSSSLQDQIQVCGVQPIRLDGCKMDFVSDEEASVDKSVKYMFSLKL